MSVPAAGLCVLTNCSAGVQESVAATFGRRLGTAAWQFAPAERMNAAGVLKMVGGVLSTTVNRTVQVELLPETSVTVTVTGCAPRPTKVPAFGLWLIMRACAGVQLSFA